MQKHQKIKNKKIGRLGGVHLAGLPGRGWGLELSEKLKKNYIVVFSTYAESVSLINTF